MAISWLMMLIGLAVIVGGIGILLVTVIALARSSRSNTPHHQTIEDSSGNPVETDPMMGMAGLGALHAAGATAFSDGNPTATDQVAPESMPATSDPMPEVNSNDFFDQGGFDGGGFDAGGMDAGGFDAGGF